MKKSSFGTALFVAIFSFSACQKVPKSGKMKFTSSIDSVSYALGYIEANNFKKNFEHTPFKMDSAAFAKFAKAIASTRISDHYSKIRKKQFDTLNTEAFYKGFINELAYGKSYFSEMNADIYLRKIFKEKKAVHDSLRKELANKNLAIGEKFLAENKTKVGVIETKSGLQYQILKKGTGKKPGPKDQVRCIYHGTLLDETVFDSSKERGDTASFRVNRVIKGWTEALQMMPEGSEWKLFIPAKLAYGERGSSKIGPNETLIFDINLVKVIEQKKTLQTRKIQK